MFLRDKSGKEEGEASEQEAFWLFHMRKKKSHLGTSRIKSGIASTETSHKSQSSEG